MRLQAIQQCLSGGRFIHSRAGNTPERDFDNPHLLSWLFPHLDPWGIGGFHHPERTQKLSMKEQLSYLLSIDDSAFARDETFAFVYYSILQKKSVLLGCIFRVKRSQYQSLMNELQQIPDQTFMELERSTLSTVLSKALLVQNLSCVMKYAH